MHGGGFFFQAFIYLVAAVVGVPIAKRLGLGSVLGYLVAGMAIGPFGFGMVGEEGKDVMHFAEFGVVIMLFVVGLELEPSKLWRLRVPILGTGGAQVGLTATALMLISLACGLSWQEALAVGLVLALSSTAIVLQTLNEKGLMATAAGRSSFAVLLFQDIAVIPMLALFPLLATHELVPSNGHHHDTWFETLSHTTQAFLTISSVAVVILGGKFLTQPLFRLIAKTRLRELFVASILLLVIGISLLMEQVGLSPALGTFIAGVVLAESEYRHELESDIEPFKGLLLGLFFISVGTSIDFELLQREPLTLAGIVLGLVAIKFAVLVAVGRAFRLSTDQNLFFAFALAQGGEFGFVLFSLAEQTGVLSTHHSDRLIAAVAMSMALTPLLLLLFEKVLRPRVGTREIPRNFDAPEAGTVIIAGFGRFGQICSRLLVAEGIKVTVLEHDSDQVELLRKYGRKVFYGDASRLDLLEAAGAGSARLLILALDQPQKTLDIVHSVKGQFPNLTVMARARSRTDAYELVEAGVEHIYRETFDTALRLGSDALRLLGTRAYQAHRASMRFRKKDEAYFRSMASHRHADDFHQTVRQQVRNLEDVIRDDLRGHSEGTDTAWSVESLSQDLDSFSK